MIKALLPPRLHRGLQDVLGDIPKRFVTFRLYGDFRKLYPSQLFMANEEFHRKLPSTKKLTPIKLRARIRATLTQLLRPDPQLLPMREDGYVAVQDVLNWPELRGVSMFLLDRVVQNDPQNRFSMVYEPLCGPGSSHGASFWWIRSNPNSIQNAGQVHRKRIYDSEKVTMAVHGTTLDVWESISRQGLSVMGGSHIHLARGVAGAAIIDRTSETPTPSQILIYINLKRALDAGIKFYLSEDGTVSTPGDEKGLLAPQFFSRVEKVFVQKTVIPLETPLMEPTTEPDVDSERKQPSSDTL